MTPDDTIQSRLETQQAELEALKFRLDKARYRTDLVKWIIVACGAIISFYVLDLGRLQLEQFRVGAENERQLLSAYLTATESAQPDIWKRKLRILKSMSNDQRMKDWAQDELKYIETFAALDALYRETLKIASQLVEHGNLNDPERIKARIRFNQLYWADLPHAGESQPVIAAMIAFREALMIAEKQPNNSPAWNVLNLKLIELSNALRNSAPQHPAQPAAPTPQ